MEHPISTPAARAENERGAPAISHAASAAAALRRLWSPGSSSSTSPSGGRSKAS